MLIKVSDELYIGDNAIVSAEPVPNGYKIELVNGNKLDINEEALKKFLKHPGRKKEGSDGSDK